MDQPSGTAADREVVRLLGRGASGDVALVRCLPSGELRVRKRMRVDGQRWSASRAEIEIRSLEKLDHPNVVRLLEVRGPHGDEGAELDLEFAYLPGRSLLEMSGALGRVRWPRLAPLMVDVLEGLAALHAEGLLHRDVKPANILVTEEGRGVLLDLGLVRDTLALDGITATGEVPCTPAYAAPENFRMETLGEGADLYSLGVTTWAMLAGRHPFEGRQGLSDIMNAHLVRPVPSLREAGVDVPAPVDAFVRQLMAKEPEDRPGSALAAADRLRSLAGLEAKPREAATEVLEMPPQAEAAPAARVEAPGAAPGGPAGGPGRGLLGLGVFAGLVVVGGGAWWLTRPVEVVPVRRGPPVASVPGTASRAESGPGPRPELHPAVHAAEAWVKVLEPPSSDPLEVRGWVRQLGVRDSLRAADASLGAADRRRLVALDEELRGLGGPPVLAPYGAPGPSVAAAAAAAEAEAEAVPPLVAALLGKNRPLLEEATGLPGLAVVAAEAQEALDRTHFARERLLADPKAVGGGRLGALAQLEFFRGRKPEAWFYTLHGLPAAGGRRDLAELYGAALGPSIRTLRGLSKVIAAEARRSGPYSAGVEVAGSFGYMLADGLLDPLLVATLSLPVEDLVVAGHVPSLDLLRGTLRALEGRWRRLTEAPSVDAFVLADLERAMSLGDSPTRVSAARVSLAASELGMFQRIQGLPLTTLVPALEAVLRRGPKLHPTDLGTVLVDLLPQTVDGLAGLPLELRGRIEAALPPRPGEAATSRYESVRRALREARGRTQDPAAGRERPRIVAPTGLLEEVVGP